MCWTQYDPAHGDVSRAIDPGTPFLHLPKDWSCPTCEAPVDAFLARDLSASPSDQDLAHLRDCTDRLMRGYADLIKEHAAVNAIMNNALRLQIVGCRLQGGRPLVVLISPNFMQLVLMPGPNENWNALEPGAAEKVKFPSGTFAFSHDVRPGIGGFKTCTLFSPMGEFHSQEHAVSVARAVLDALFEDGERTAVHEIAPSGFDPASS